MSARHKLTPTQELSADVDYVYYFNNNPTSTNFSTITRRKPARVLNWLNNTKQTPVQLWVARSDYTRAFGPKTNLELGAKATFSHFDNNIQAVRQTNGEWIKDPVNFPACTDG
jgi:hypothetical protein